MTVFEYLSYPGESIKVKIGQAGIGEYNYFSPAEQNDAFDVFGSQLLTLFVPTFFDSIKTHMKTLDSSADNAEYNFILTNKTRHTVSFRTISSMKIILIW